MSSHDVSSESSPKLKPASGNTWSANKKMSFEQLHTKLTERLQNRSHLNDLKAELRNKLINELFDMGSRVSATTKVLNNQSTKLPLQVSNWLICDFLKRENYEFTLSTFLRESQLVNSPENSFTIEDILHILSIPKTSELHKDLICIYENNADGCLIYHMIHRLLTDVPFLLPKTKSEINTDKFEVRNEGDDNYLRQRIDKEIRNRINMVFQSLKHPEMVDIEKVDSELGCVTSVVDTHLVRAKELVEKDNQPDEQSQTVVSKENKWTQTNFQFEESNSHLTSLSEQNRILQNQVNSLKEVVSSQSDYNIMKSELEMLKKDLESTMKHLHESHMKNLEIKNHFEQKFAELTLEMVTPSSELLKVHKEFKKAEITSKQNQESLKLQNTNLSEELEQLKIDYDKSLKRIEDLKHHVNSLNQLTERLQSEIQNLRWLQEEKERHHFRAKTCPNYVHHGPRYPAMSPQYASNIPLQYRSDFSLPYKRTDPSTSSSNSNGPIPPSFIQEAKSRIDILQAEAESLERKYGRCLENQLRAPSVSSCFPYHLEAQLKVASQSVPSLYLVDNDEVYSSRPIRYSSTNDLYKQNVESRCGQDGKYMEKHIRFVTNDSGEDVMSLFPSKVQQDENYNEGVTDMSRPKAFEKIESVRKSNSMEIINETFPSYYSEFSETSQKCKQAQDSSDHPNTRPNDPHNLIPETKEIKPQETETYLNTVPNFPDRDNYDHSQSIFPMSSKLNFLPTNQSTPISKVSEGNEIQRNLSTLYENQDVEDDSVSEKSLSLGNQKEENSEEFW